MLKFLTLSCAILLLPVIAIALIVAGVVAIFLMVVFAPILDILSYQPSKFSDYGNPNHYKG